MDMICNHAKIIYCSKKDLYIFFNMIVQYFLRLILENKESCIIKGLI